jgi:EAL domain-containing protein (putative c-di-GMP-specific phosphodiesterase class I)
VNCDRITFEITETAVMRQPKIFMDILARLRLKMFSLSVDDFGTGYSSLLELYRLPFNELKIDKSFIIGLDKDDDSRIIVAAIIELYPSHLKVRTMLLPVAESYQ